MDDESEHTCQRVPPSNKPERRVVLLVDDDADWRMLVRDALEQSQIAAESPLEIHEASDGEAALQFLRRQGDHAQAPRPHLVYLDGDMPRLDGLATLLEMRRDPRLQAVPTIMLTGVSDEASMRLAVRLGANAYIVKPSDAADLAHAISASAGHWLRLPRAAVSTPQVRPMRVGRAA